MRAGKERMGSIIKQPLSLLKTMVVLFFISFNATAQDEPSPCDAPDNKKAKKYFEQSQDKKKYEFKERLEFLKKALEEAPDYPDALYEMAMMNIKIAKADNTSFKPAEKYFLRLIEICPDYNAYPYFYLGQMAYGANKYEEAAKYLKKFLKDAEKVKSDEDYNTANTMVKRATFFAEAFKNPVPFDPVVVPGVCTYEDEYLAMLSPDNELLYFTKKYQKKGKNELTPRTVEEFMESRRTPEGSYPEGSALPPPFNVGDNYGGVTFTLDNKTLYITICKPDKKTGSLNCDIYSSTFVKDNWQPFVNLGPNVNTSDGWEAQPTLSSDGKTLYFSSYRADSKKMDIYKTEKQADGSWGPAINMGAPINTDGNEKSPFIHSDSQTLYYSSDGHPGMGGYDIFFTKADPKDKKWKHPKNIGYPINTEQDEVGFFVSTNGKLGYFASNAIKGKGKGGYDIFSFELYKEARPEKILFLKGELKDELGQKLDHASMHVTNPNTKEVHKIEVDSLTGEYAGVITFANHEDFVVTVEKEGHAFSSKLVTADEKTEDAPVVKTDFEVKAVLPGAPYQLNNINYKTNSADLMPESKYIVEEFANYLKQNQSMKIEIHGHTDNVGNPTSNMALSTDRAFTIYALLQELGIPKDRLAFKGFGSSKPVASNDNEEGRAKNRRTEFVILSK